MGFLIQRFRLQPFIVTLAGMFLARGLCYLISIDSISITEPILHRAGRRRALPLWGGASLSRRRGDRAVVVLLAAVFIAHYTPFGRTVYAIGGNEQSALLMGLPVRAHAGRRLHASAASARRWPAWCSPSTCSRATACTRSGLELDAIAAVVIGGTLLTGGVGYVVGTLFGVLMLGIIQTLITFDGTLSSWWTRIVDRRAALRVLPAAAGHGAGASRARGPGRQGRRAGGAARCLADSVTAPLGGCSGAGESALDPQETSDC